MKTKLFAFVMVGILLLAGCSNQAEPQQLSEDELKSNEVSTVDVKSECGLLYAESLKLGSTAADTITSEHPDWSYEGTDTEEIWNLSVENGTRINYTRNGDGGKAIYTVSFQVNSSPIDNWINKEVQDMDKLLATTHKRDVVADAVWSYEWVTSVDVVRLKVFATGKSGECTAVFSAMRLGPTFLDEKSTEEKLNGTN